MTHTLSYLFFLIIYTFLIHELWVLGAFIQTDHYHEAYQLIVNDQRLELVFILLTLISYFGRLSLEHLLKGTIAINVGKNMTEHLTKIPPQFRLELEGRVWWQQFLKNFCNLVKSRDL